MRQYEGMFLFDASTITGEGEAKERYPNGWKSPKPYIRIVPQPKA